jgi:hypothetical protein
MRVFVLTTGRAASQTVARAAAHIEGMTAAHESRRGLLDGRLGYPDNHVEVDNRLVWFLGSLDRLYDDDQTFYVVLKRDADAVAASYVRRWHITVSIVRAFYNGILMSRKRKPSPSERQQAARLFVQTVEDNVDHFLRNRDNCCVIRTDSLEADFFRFLDRAGLDGDREAMRRELATVYNRSKRRKTVWEKLARPFRR